MVQKSGSTASSESSSQRVEKDDIYWRVLNSAIALDFENGHQRWTISDLSRASGITRSLIYYYFGKSRLNILTEAVKLIGEEMFGFKQNKLALWEQGKVADSIFATGSILRKAPYLGAFYFSHRDRDSAIGKSLQDLEKKYLEKLKRFFPQTSVADLTIVFGIFMGIALTPNIEKESVEKVVAVVMRVLRKVP